MAGLFIATLLYYLPALLGSGDNPQEGNLLAPISKAFGGGSVHNQDTGFYADWAKARDEISNLNLPLWYHFENGYPGYSSKVGARALLAESSAPILYPLSAIYYAIPAKGLTLFALIHLWLMGLGLVLLSRKIWPGRRLGLLWLLLLIPAGLLQEDWLAALAWLPLGMWLLRSKRWTGRLLFAPICGLVLLAIDWPVALLLIGALIGWALVCEVVLRQAGVSQLLRLAGLLLVMLLLGAGIAGPQLFPRLSYTYGPDQSPAFTSPPAGLISEVRPVQNIQITRQSKVSVQANRAEIEINVPPGTAAFDLVLAERYTGGWTATIFGKQLDTESTKSERDKQTDREREALKGREGKVGATPEGWQATRIMPAPEGGTFRIVFRYNPMAFTLGLYAAFLSVAAVAVCFVVIGWGRFYREDEGSHPIRRVAKNSVTPLFAQLFGKALDFGFALFSLRLLTPEGNGRYTIATTTWLILATLTDFGLETLVTRDVARDRSFENANRHFFTMLFTRFGLAVLSFPVALLWVGSFSMSGNMASDTSWAILLLVLGFFPGSISSSMTALFRGYEKYEYLAVIQILTAIIRVPLGLGALLAGWGVIGLAGSSVVVGCITAVALGVLFRREIFQPRIKGAFDPKLARSLLLLSYPLVLNGLLNNILFKSDALLLGALRSDTEVGLYNSAYKFIDAVLIIPSTFTLALFPILAGYASNARNDLKRAYTEGLRLLLIIGLPISAGTLFVAYDLIGALGGAQYLPGGAICLQILIWFLPFSYVNGLTQYVLIALNQQRLITFAVAAAAAANLILNVIFMPIFGYVAACAMTIVSELVMLLPFCWIARRELGSIPYWQISWRPLLGAVLMIVGLFGLTVGLQLNHFFITVPVGGAIYIITLFATRTITAADLRMFKKIVARN